MQIGRSKDSIFSQYSDICLWLFLQQVKENLKHLKMIFGNILTETKKKTFPNIKIISIEQESS